MVKELKIESKVIDVYSREEASKELPVVILNTYGNEGKEVFNKCIELGCENFLLVSISNLDWNNDMSPWFALKLNEHGEDFLGKADKYIEVLVNNIIPSVEKYLKHDLKISVKYYGIVGYSLAGLFAVYSGYKTEMFGRIASASGSFWFPKFIDFVKENKISSNVEKIYFSLGNKESKVRNEIMKTVEGNTKEIERIYNSQGIKTIYEENQGNHFKDGTLRMAKGIKWILE